MGKHLDLGCWVSPRNPYGQEILYGVDQSLNDPERNIRPCQLGLEKIPFEDNFFDSVSAYDLLEHIPRQAVDYAAVKINFPFVFLMSEIWRVLKPNGVFLALTPAFPSKQAFQDPTHVNIITEDTHSYFTGNESLAKRYGFYGNFETIHSEWVLPEEVYSQQPGLKLKIKKWRYRIFNQKKITHLKWELKAIKT